MYIDQLNAECTCVSLDRKALFSALETEVGDAEFCKSLSETHPTLISNLPVYIRPDQARQMSEAITAIEAICSLESYQEEALKYAPEIARVRSNQRGVFMGYDFHIGIDGAKLIEINTNAGGALINAFVAEAQHVCCAPVRALLPIQSSLAQTCAAFIEHFEAEWRRSKPNQLLTRVAIVDTNPEQQYLYPEFVLFQKMFQKSGIEAVITAPAALTHHSGRLWLGDKQIDLVYNRLTDFYFEEEDSAQLASAYRAGDVVITPNPRTHAIFANKRNLVLLSDAEALRQLGAAQSDISIVTAVVPKTRMVTLENADELWTMRAQLFFKPLSGFGGKAAYRGEKITRKVWQTILDGSFVAQEYAKPSERLVAVDGIPQAMKVDIRNYSYDGKISLVAARLYKGQMTNFRTPGGGFTPAYSFPDVSLDGAMAASPDACCCAPQ